MYYMYNFIVYKCLVYYNVVDCLFLKMPMMCFYMMRRDMHVSGYVLLPALDWLLIRTYSASSTNQVSPVTPMFNVQEFMVPSDSSRMKESVTPCMKRSKQC